MNETVSLLPIAVDTYTPHKLHRGDRDWNETNCYIDLWIEVLSALGLEPRAANSCALSSNFQGDQWDFLKYEPEDLRTLYGISVGEMNIWRPVVEHVVEQLRFGRLLTVEVDSFYLPDTAGIAYQIAHTKTTIVPNAINVEQRTLDYFHNAGYFQLDADDFDRIFNLVDPDPRVLLPYIELVDLDRMEVKADLPSIARSVARDHLSYAPSRNPIEALGVRLQEDIPAIQEGGLDQFHLYAFGMLRQCGVSAELAADFAEWMSEHEPSPELDAARENFAQVSADMKSLQLRMARVARGRTVDLAEPIASLAQSWSVAINAMKEWGG